MTENILKDIINSSIYKIHEVVLKGEFLKDFVSVTIKDLKKNQRCRCAVLFLKYTENKKDYIALNYLEIDGRVIRKIEREIGYKLSKLKLWLSKDSFFSKLYSNNSPVEIKNTEEIINILKNIFQVRSKEKFKEIIASCTKKWTEYLYLVPLFFNNNNIGHITLIRDIPFTKNEKIEISVIAHQLALILCYKRTELKYKDAEKDLIEISEKYQSLYNSINEYVFVFSFKGEFIDANNAALNKFGYTKEDIKKLSFKDLLSEDQLFKAFKEITEIMKHGSSCRPRIYKVKSRNGPDVFIESMGSLIYNDGTPYAIQGIARDITVRVKTQANLIKRDNELISLYNAMNEGLAIHKVIYDISGKPVDYLITDINPAFEKITGLKRTDVVGKKGSEAYNMKDVPYLYIFARVAKTGESHNFTTYFPAIKKHFSISVFSPKKGEFATVFNDVTEQRNLQEQLIRSEKFSAIGRLSSGIAHEFNNLLAVIMANAEFCLTEESLNEIKSSLSVIVDCSQRGRDIVKNLSIIAKPNNSEFKVDDITKAIDKVLKLEKKQLLDDNVEVSRDYQTNLKTKFDFGQMEQVFLNLIINACHALKSKSRRYIKISVLDNKNRIIIKVEDNGVGMTRDVQKRIFEPFFSTKGVYADDDDNVDIIKGTGLGLSVSYTIINQHNGTISVESIPNKGSIFTIHLPVVKGREIEDTDVDHKTDFMNRMSDLSIMIVDDEPEILNILSKMLNKIGYNQVETCNNSNKALESLKNNKPDIVFVDFMMPTINGFEFLKQSKDISPDMPVVFITGKQEIKKNEYIEKGAFDMVKKPFHINEIISIINRIFQ